MIPTGSLETRTSSQALPRAPSSGTMGPAISASYIGKLQTLEDLIKQIQDEESIVTKDVMKMRADKDALESDLSRGTTECREILQGEITAEEDEMQRYISNQKAENSRLQLQITQLKADKATLQDQVLALTTRIQDIENSLGGYES